MHSAIMQYMIVIDHQSTLTQLTLSVTRITVY